MAVTAANVQDRVAAHWLVTALRACSHRLRHIWADSAYTGTWITRANKLGITVQIVAKLTGQKGFQVLHRRWVVERTLAWITRCRRTVRDYEHRPEHHAAMVHWAMIIIMSRRLARQQTT